MVDLSVHARLISTPTGGVALGPMTDSIKDIRAEVARSPLAAESDVVCHACLWAGTRDALPWPSAPAEGEAARPGTISILDVH